MPIRSLDNWATSQNKSQTLPLSVLKDTTIGIEADHYLLRLLTTSPSKEPLVTALGGFPFGLRYAVEGDIEDFQKAGIKPVFVFSGLKIVRNEKPFSVNDDGPAKRSQAWDLYDQGLASEAVEAFGAAGTLQPHEVYKYFIKILHECAVDLQVAPYSAWPQLVYLEKNGFVDSICGNSELFFFDVEKVIVHLNPGQGGSFTWINKQKILSDLHLTNDMFIDACVLAGSEICRAFPPFEGSPHNAFMSSVELLKRCRNVATVVSTHPEPIQQSGYLDRYRKARAAVKHHAIFTSDGKAEPLDFAEAPSDVHEFIGQRLPEELYYYLSKGVIGPQVLDMLATGELIEIAPFDNGDSDEYKKFLENLNPLRTQALGLLAQPLHRFWFSKEINVYYWFDKNNPRKLIHKEVSVSPAEQTRKWNVRESVFKPELEKDGSSIGLAFAISSLKSDSFAAKTIAPKDEVKLLNTRDEILMNTHWRMLQLRGFIDSEKHSLTPWGRALEAAISTLDPSDTLDEPVYLGIELLRLKVLKPDNFSPSLTGAPTRGTEDERAYIMLISRVASLVPINHKPIGYTGPLSRNLLGFNSFITKLTRTMRSFAEMVLVNLLMNGDADRGERTDWTELGLGIPFIDEVSAGLGIAAKTYLDELSNETDPIPETTRRAQKEKLPLMFAQAVDIEADVDLAFRTWDAIIAAVKSLQKEGQLASEAKVFLAADKWLTGRR